MQISKSQFSTVVADILCLAAVGIPILLLKYLGQAAKKGFFCSDDSLRHPYFDSTIPTTVNVSVSYGIPLTIILLTHISQLCCGRTNTLRSVIRNTYQDCIFFILGVFTVQLLSGVCKLSSGRLRPHFIAVCRPDIEFTSQICGTWDNPVYVTNFTCSGNSDLFPNESTRTHRIRESRLSFLSGHTSLACYGMTFGVFFLQTRTKKIRASTLAVGLLQAMMMIYATYCSLSRVADNKHHPTDVGAGAVLGSALALGIVYCASRRDRAKYTTGSDSNRRVTEIESKVP